MGDTEERIFGIDTPEAFTACALDTFRRQYALCPQYRQYADLLEAAPDRVRDIADIPFLPIRFFKQYDIISSAEPQPVAPQKIFSAAPPPARHPRAIA